MKKKPGYPEEALLADIQSGGKRLEAAMRYLYFEHSCRAQIANWVRKQGGSKEDEADLFQEGICSLIYNIRAGKFQGTGSLTGYLFGICRNLWRKQLQKRKLAQRYDGEASVPAQAEPDPEGLLIAEDQARQWEEVLDKLGRNCREVLELWKLGYSMKEIAQAMQYKHEGIARKKKHLCLQSLLKLLEQHPHWQSWLR